MSQFKWAHRIHIGELSLCCFLVIIRRKMSLWNWTWRVLIFILVCFWQRVFVFSKEGIDRKVQSQTMKAHLCWSCLQGKLWQRGDVSLWPASGQHGRGCGCEEAPAQHCGAHTRLWAGDWDSKISPAWEHCQVQGCLLQRRYVLHFCHFVLKAESYSESSNPGSHSLLNCLLFSSIYVVTA